jgi:hypothetical protein
VFVETDAFIDQWVAHGVPLSAARDVRHDQFILVGVNERAAGVSGCSIDALVRRMGQLQSALGVELINNAPVLFRSGDRIERVPRERFAELAENGGWAGHRGLRQHRPARRHLATAAGSCVPPTRGTACIFNKY